jgi:hypothetical protein
MPRKAKRKRRRRARQRGRIVNLPAEYFEGIEIGNSLFPSLYQFENGLRVLLHSYLTTCYGPDWWAVSLQPRLRTVFDYAENQQRRLDSMPWIGASSVVTVLPIHLVTLGHLEELVKIYRSDCIPQLFGQWNSSLATWKSSNAYGTCTATCSPASRKTIAKSSRARFAR